VEEIVQALVSISFTYHPANLDLLKGVNWNCVEQIS